MAEGAPLLREYGVYSLIEGSNPSLSATPDLVGALQSLINLERAEWPLYPTRCTLDNTVTTTIINMTNITTPFGPIAETGTDA